MGNVIDKIGLSGFTELFQSRKNPVRFLFWMICLIGLTSFCIFSTMVAIRNYITSPTVTSVTTENPDDGVKLPEMLLCYKGGWNVHKMERFKFSNELSEFLMRPYTELAKMPSLPLGYEEEFWQRLKLYNLTINLFYHDVSFNCQDIVGSRVVSTNSIKDKCENVFQQIFEPNFPDSCLLFKNTSTQVWPSIVGGIVMTLKKPTDRAVPISKSIKGFEVEFASTYDSTTPYFSPSNIPANFRTTFSLKATRYTRLKNYGLCTTGTTLSSCKFNCFKKQFYNICQCALISHYPDANQSICSPFDYHKCITTNMNLVRRNAAKCISPCLLQCEEWEYDVTAMSKPLDLDSKENDTLAIMEVGFKDLKYTQIAEVAAFSVDMVVGNIGGIIGLYLGGSFVTLFQLIYYTVLCVAEKRQAKRPA